MALRLKYAALILLLGWAGLAAAYLPPQCEGHHTLLGCQSIMSPYGPPAHEAVRLDMLDRVLNRERPALAMLETRDRVNSLLSQRGTPQPAIWMSSAFSADNAARLGQDARKAWAALQPVNPNVRIAFAFVRGSSGFAYLLPKKAGEPCIADLGVWVWDDRGGRQRIMDGWNARPTEALLGPCGFYAAFGMPGPGIGAWLADGGAMYAAGGVMPRQHFDRSSQGASPFYEVFSIPGLACQQGVAAQCGVAVRNPVSADWRDRNGLRAFQRRVPGAVFPAQTGLSIYGSSLLGDLVRTQGREKFARFWQSSLPLDSAFLAAFGTPIEIWTRDWARNHQDATIRHLRTSSVLVSLLCIVVFVSGGAAYSMRRQVGV